MVVKRKKKDKRFGPHFVDYDPCFLGLKGKKRKRVRSLDWIISGGGGELLEESSIESSEKVESDEELRNKVREAVEKLPLIEKRFVEKFYFEFKTYLQIAKELNKKVYKLDRIHRQALDRLRIILESFVKQRFKIECAQISNCPICNHSQKDRIDEIIKSKSKQETWKRVINILKKEFNLEIKTPQVLISHKNNHIVK